MTQVPDNHRNNEETDGFEIKDAELFEVSVVSVPANQTAMFSLAKSFDSDQEYQEFKNLFRNKIGSMKVNSNKYVFL